MDVAFSKQLLCLTWADKIKINKMHPAALSLSNLQMLVNDILQALIRVS